MKERVYMPNNKEIREKILKEHYDPANIGASRTTQDVGITQEDLLVDQG